MLNRKSLSILIVIITAVWAIGLWALGIPLSWEHAKPYGSTVTTVTLLLWIFDTFLWYRWPFRLFVRVPSIQGSWRVELRSTFKDPVTGEPSKPLIGYVSVRQRLSNLSLNLMTLESNSHLIAHNFLFPDEQTIELMGAYQSDPSIHTRGTSSEIHYGAFKVRLSGKPVDRIEGHYWTDRSTTGSITYLEQRRGNCDRFDLAQALFSAPKSEHRGWCMRGKAN